MMAVRAPSGRAQPTHRAGDGVPGQFLAYLERRRQEAQTQLDELAQRRASMSAQERLLAHEALRSQAAALRNELRRVKLATSVTKGLVCPPVGR